MGNLGDWEVDEISQKEGFKEINPAMLFIWDWICDEDSQTLTRSETATLVVYWPWVVPKQDKPRQDMKALKMVKTQQPELDQQPELNWPIAC